MYSREQTLMVYVDLAEVFQRRNDAGLRETFLVLAADAALKAGQPGKAELLRAELLRENPYHLLKPYPTFAEAIQHPDIEGYIADLREKYPVEVAQDMLDPQVPETLALPMPIKQNDAGPMTPPPTPRQRSTVGEEPLKVYREAPDVSETQPPPTLPPQRPLRPTTMPRQPAPRPAPPAPARPRPAAPAPPPTAAARPRPAPAPRAPAPVPAPPQPTRQVSTPASTDDGKLTPGAWVGTTLFMLVLAAGVALLMLALFPHELLDNVIQGF